jgi:adenylate cyclase
MTGSDFERRAWLAVIWEDLANPVRAVQAYQEAVLEECRRAGLADPTALLEKAAAAGKALGDLVEGLRNPSSPVETALVDPRAKLRHDLRTPLNAIIGYSELALEEIEAEGTGKSLRPDLEKALEEARRLLALIDRIIDVSQSGAGAETERLVEQAGAATAVVAELLRTLRPGEDRGAAREVGRILVVDDNEANRGLLARRLTQDGHEVSIAASGREAFDILRAQRFDLVLLDLLMPVMSGLEVLTKLKADERWHKMPVIMVSGLQETGAVLKCIELGAEDYLPKPCDVVLLRARINACLERNRWHERERQYLERLREEKEKSDRLLRNILPEPIVLRLNNGETVIADRFEAVSILFADIVGFTEAAAVMSPAKLVDRLDRVFSAFDDLALRLGVEKIKTIGDAYMAATGLPQQRPDHVEAIAKFAIGMLEALKKIDEPEQTLNVRIGVHTGPVVAGVIGRHKFIYDVWGDTVNVASRLESHGVAGRIQVSERVRQALADRFAFEPRGTIDLKGKGLTTAFLLVPPACVPSPWMGEG